MNHIKELEKINRRNRLVVFAMLAAVIVIGIACLFVGSSNMTFTDAMNALQGVDAAGKSTDELIRAALKRLF